jgi:divalent metal cation (Fe/Co/Zn/Cd) transporter
LIVGYQAVRSAGQHLLDAVDPAIVERMTASVSIVDGVVAVIEAKTCWGRDTRLLAQVRAVGVTLSLLGLEIGSD